MNIKINLGQTQQIGTAVQFLGFDGLIVPSARWECKNLVLFTNNHDDMVDMEGLNRLVKIANHGFYSVIYSTL